MSLGENISELRRKSGWKKSELAEKLGVTKETIVKWEKDKVEPSIAELIKMANLFEVTVDELLQNLELIEQRRENYYRELFRNIYFIISSFYGYKYEDTMDDLIRKSSVNYSLGVLYRILSDRFCSSEGEIYEKYLVKNSTKEERYKWVKFINGEHVSKEEGPFEDYVDGKCEVDEIFERLEKEFNEESRNIQSRIEQKREEEKSGIYATCRNIASIARMLRSHETFSDKMLNEQAEKLHAIASKLDQDSFAEKVLLLYCKEIESAWEAKDDDKMDELIKECDALRVYVRKKMAAEFDFSKHLKA